MMCKREALFFIFIFYLLSIQNIYAKDTKTFIRNDKAQYTEHEKKLLKLLEKSINDIIIDKEIRDKDFVNIIKIKYQKSEPEIEQYFIENLESSDFLIQRRSIYVLKSLNIKKEKDKKIISEKIHKILKESFDNRNFNNINLDKVILLSTIYPHKKNQGLLKSIINDKTAPDNIRKKSIQALGKLKAKETIPELIELMKSNDKEICLPAMDSLLIMKYKDIENLIINNLSQEDKTIKLRSINALLKIGTPRCVEPLKKILEIETDSMIILQSCKVLEKITNEKFIEKYFIVRGDGSYSLIINK